VTPAIATAQVQQAATELVGYINDMISKGATQLYVFNLPDSSLTPFGVASGAAGQALLQSLVNTFNATLVAGLNGTTARVIDFNAQLTAGIKNGAQFGFSNTSTPACDATKINALVPSAGGSSLFCSANTLVAAGADQTYLFADGVHPTTAGHRLIASNVLTRLLADTVMH
jgi:phospholipase/lecithinase/hemolysin